MGAPIYTTDMLARFDAWWNDLLGTATSLENNSIVRDAAMCGFQAGHQTGQREEDIRKASPPQPPAVPQGISLRDYLAGQAFHAIYLDTRSRDFASADAARIAAREAYSAADTMLEARK